MDLNTTPKKRNMIPVIAIGLTFVLAGVAVVTALRLYQLRAPNAPESRPAAADTALTTTSSSGFDTASCSVLTFNISTPTPTGTATATPTGTPTSTPTSTPTDTPTSTPTATPTTTATATATPTGTATATPRPSSTPTSTPVELPATGFALPTVFGIAVGFMLLAAAAFVLL